MDDGEKFGAWTGTHKLCYREGWLERFFRGLEERAEDSPRSISAKPSGWRNRAAASICPRPVIPR